MANNGSNQRIPEQKGFQSGGNPIVAITGNGTQDIRGGASSGGNPVTVVNNAGNSGGSNTGNSNSSGGKKS